MKITKRQQEEVEFLIKHFGAKNSPKEIEEYLSWTVKGIKPKNEDNKRSNNTLFQAKRRLDISVQLWTNDLRDGLLAYWELEEDFKCDYFDRVLSTIRKSITPHATYDGLLPYATLGYLNSKYNL